MKIVCKRVVGSEKNESGFTLPEVLIVIAILGILLAIAVPTWFGVVESRQVDSATNQFASDLRLAHNKATNQLQEWEVVYTVGDRDYELVPQRSGDTITRTLPEGTKILNWAAPISPDHDRSQLLQQKTVEYRSEEGEVKDAGKKP